jgi:hypothetical protein
MLKERYVDGQPVYYQRRGDSPYATEHCSSCAASLFCVTGLPFLVVTCGSGCGRVMDLKWAYPLSPLFGTDADAGEEVVNDVLRCILRRNYDTRVSVVTGQSGWCGPCYSHRKKQGNTLRDFADASRTGARLSHGTVFSEGPAYVTGVDQAEAKKRGT